MERVVIQVHNWHGDVSVKQWSELLRLISDHGFLLFAKEPNLLCPRTHIPKQAWLSHPRFMVFTLASTHIRAVTDE